MEIRDLIGFNHVIRGLYFDALTKLPWAQVVEPKWLSFDSMQNVFLHLTLIEDRWINYIILTASASELILLSMLSKTWIHRRCKARCRGQN
jgi:hypothetical protein